MSRKIRQGATPDIPPAGSGHAASRSGRYAAYALAADGSRRRLDAAAIIIDTGAGRFRVDLHAITPMMAGRLSVTIDGDGSLTLGPGSGNSAYLGVFRLAHGEEETS